MLVSIARALEQRDQTLGHGARVAALAEPVALRAGLGPRADSLPSLGCAAARRRQGQDPAAAARQVRAAHARRGRRDPEPPGRRRTARAAAAAVPRRAPVRPLPPRALGRRGLPGGAERTPHPDRGSDSLDRRRLRRDDLAAAVPPRAHARARAHRGRRPAPARSSTPSRRSSSSTPGPTAGTPGTPPQLLNKRELALRHDEAASGGTVPRIGSAGLRRAGRRRPTAGEQGEADGEADLDARDGLDLASRT